MRRDWLLLIIIGLLIGLCSRTEADVLCRDQGGTLSVREACRKGETRLNPAALGLVGAPGPKGEKGERGPRGQQGPSGESGTLTPQKLAPNSEGAPQTRAPWWQVWLLLITAGVVTFYASETYRLRRDAQTQTELQLRPFVIFEPTDGTDFAVRNIGNNTALNVRVVTLALSPSPPVLVAFPRPVPFLRKDEGRLLPLRTAKVGGEEVHDDSLFEILRPLRESLIEPEADSFRPTITLEFDNIKGQHYFVQESLLHGEVEIVNFGPITASSSSTLWSVWHKLQMAQQKLWTAWQQFRLPKFRLPKKERASEPAPLDDQEWVDGR